jgi:hypothetical protein
MIFFEFSFRQKIPIADFISKIGEFYKGKKINFFSVQDFYNAESKIQDVDLLIVYECFYNDEGFQTFFKGQVYNLDENFNEFLLALHLSTAFNTDLVINDFTTLSDFILIKNKNNIYRVNPIGLGDPEYRNGVFEIDYKSAKLAADLICLSQDR